MSEGSNHISSSTMVINDGLTKEFYETFWNKRKEIFVDHVLETKEKGHVGIYQRQAIIMLLEKKKEIRDS